MKKVFKFILIIFCVILLIGLTWEAIVIARARRTVDFGGTVQEITVDSDTITFRVYEHCTYTVVADRRTKVRLAGVEKAVTAADIQVGDIITGDYRWATTNHKAKYIEFIDRTQDSQS